jgi:hypothetical protein
VKRAISRSFARHAFRLTGRLLNGQGHPIGSATLDVLQQTTEGGPPRVITHARTRADDSFVVRVPAGPSRAMTDPTTTQTCRNKCAYVEQIGACLPTVSARVEHMTVRNT